MKSGSILNDQNKLNNLAMQPGHYSTQVKLSEK